MVRNITIVLMLFFCVSTSFAQNTDDIDETADRIERFVDRLLDQIEDNFDRYGEGDLYTNDDFDSESEDSVKSSSEAITFNGDTEIAENDTIQGDLVVKNGRLTIFGTVSGDVLVVNGEIELRSTSRILGNVRAMNGSVIKKEGAFVEGYIEQSTNGTPKKYRRKTTRRAVYSYTFKPYFWNTENIVDDNFIFRYNRVEGFFFGFGSEKKYYWDGSRIISGFGSFGYGISSHKWRLQLGLDRQFANNNDVLYEVGTEVHSFTDTKDEWIIPLGENNLSSIFFREDNRDYFQREGFSFHTARYGKDKDLHTVIDVRWLNDRYTTLYNGAQWGLFNQRTFRNNPAINEGIMKSVTVGLGLSTIEKYRYQSEGWNIYARAEIGGNGLGGNFDFTQAIVDLRRLQPISDHDQINVRLRAGTLEVLQYVQKKFELGGVNTMPAYGYKEFSGNRMILANLEYQLGGELLDEVFFFPNSMNVILFGNAGAVTSVNNNWAVYEGFTDIKKSEVKSDYGVALGFHDGSARLGFAWRTDKPSPVAIFFRLNRAF